jgi:predicted RNA binding protein YcfA (HicA-like mRNA interferase family)
MDVVRDQNGISSGSVEPRLQAPEPSGHTPAINQTFGYNAWVTWGELIRRLKAAGFVEARTGKGSHRQLINRKTGQVITVAVHTKKEVGTGLAAKILKEAGL